MDLFKSGNPTLSEKRFKDTVLDDVVTHENAMTVRGTLQKFGFLFLMMMGTAFYAWKEFLGGGSNAITFIYVGGFGGLAIAIILIFKTQWAPYLAPAYALLKGLFVGSISAYYSTAFAEVAPGIVLNAVGLTFGTAIAMYLLYSFKIIKATAKFKAIIMTATVGIFIFYIIAFALSFFGITIPFLHEGSAIGIGFSVFVVALAALNLILDFDMIENGAALGAPKYMEWYGAFGLLVTIIWLYLEILRLLSKISSSK
jgi:uncharacterized YccA/Bax inhibitor family protein